MNGTSKLAILSLKIWLGLVHKAPCSGCEAGPTRSLASRQKELHDLQANAGACFLYEATLMLRLRSNASVFLNPSCPFSNLKPQFIYHAGDLTHTEDTNVFEKGCLLHCGPNVSCFLLSRGAAYRNSQECRRFRSDGCRRHAPTTCAAVATAAVAPTGRRASGRRNPSTAGAMVLDRFAGQLTRDARGREDF